MDPENRTVPDNDWALRFLANVGEDFYGTLALEFRAGQVRKIIRSEASVPPSILEQHGMISRPRRTFSKASRYRARARHFLRRSQRRPPRPTGGAPKERLD